MGFWSKYFIQGIFGRSLGGYIWSADRTKQYREYLKTEAWQRKRYVVLKRDNWVCQNCGSKATQVHHKNILNITLVRSLLNGWFLCVSLATRNNIEPPRHFLNN